VQLVLDLAGLRIGPATAPGDHDRRPPEHELQVPPRDRRRIIGLDREHQGRAQRLLDSGVYTSVTEISEAEHIGKSYISRSLRLALLAPDIIGAILTGRSDQAPILERLERPLPASWAGQRLLVFSAAPS
jgi:hypothetical protein